MSPQLQFYEFVRITAQPPRLRETVVGREGIVVGMSDPHPNGKRDYGVWVFEHKQVFALPGDGLTTLGRIGTRADVV
ncbi:MAG TPA: hypothetical protein VHC70_05560 [Phycisphaerales bacterium]|nr:hypothetical protein [Phycisphaerales bacterium]